MPVAVARQLVANARYSLSMSLAVLASLPAFGQEVAPVDGQAPASQAKHLSVQARLTVQETLTDNVNLTSQAQSGVITSVSPGVHIVERGARVSGTLDYSLSGIVYSGGSRPSQLQNSLLAQGHAELVQNILFVDVTGNITHQNTSAFGPLSTSSYSGTSNVQEVGSVGVAPYVLGRLGSFAKFELRDAVAYTNARHSIVGDSRSNTATARIDELNGGKLTWWSSLSSQRTHFRSNGVEAQSDQALVGLQWIPDIDFKGTVFDGRERSNYLLGAEANANTYGATGLWTPNPRTRLEADWQRHSYGSSHSVMLDYRLARSALRASDISSVNLGAPQTGGSVQTNYDLLYMEFASVEPDPVQRDALVRAYLKALGLDPNAQVVSAFATNGPTLQHSQQLAYSLNGLRTNWIATLSQGWTRQLGSNALPTGVGLFSAIRMRGASLTASHKLTPTSSANLSYGYQQNTGTAVGGSPTQSNLRTLLASWSGSLGPKSNLTVSLRHADGGGTGAYHENAVVGSFVQAF